MNLNKFLAGALLALPFASFSSAQSYVLVAEETFDYPAGNLGGLMGGTGWFNAWWSGFGENDALVASPSIDAVGNKIQTQTEDGGSYRIPESGPHPDIAPDFRFGSGDGVMWFRMLACRFPGATDDYGGFSLNEQFVGEKLFVGGVFATGEWGIADPIGGGSVTVAGSNVGAITELVFRVTFTSAGETVDLWLNPGNPHPASTPDATLAVADFVWNEVRFQSGANNMGTTAYDFDALTIEKEASPIGMSYCGPAVANSSGGPATISATGNNDAAVGPYIVMLSAESLPQNQFGYFIAGMNQASIPMPGGSQGTLCIGAPQVRITPSLSSSGIDGFLAWTVDVNNVDSLGSGMAGVDIIAAGDSWNFQVWFRDLNPGQTSNFSDGVTITFL